MELSMHQLLTLCFLAPNYIQFGEIWLPASVVQNKSTEGNPAIESY